MGSQLEMDMRKQMIEIWTGPNCGWCVRAKKLLTGKQLEFTELTIADKDDVKEFSVRTNGATTIPQIFIDDIHIGGYEDLVKYYDGKEE